MGDALSHPQKLLGISQAEIRQKCQERVKELEELKTAVDSLKVMKMMTCSLRTPLHSYNTINNNSIKFSQIFMFFFCKTPLMG